MINYKLGTFESISLVLIIIITHTVLSLPKHLIESTKSATIINLIYVSILAVIVILLICKLLKNFHGMDILDISNFLGGKKYGNIIKNCLGVIFIAYFIISVSISLRNFCECLKIVYYPRTNIIFIISFFIVAILIISKLNFSAIIKTNLLIIPFSIFSILFLFLGNLNNFSFERMFPLLGEGSVNTFITGIGNIYAFSGIIFLYFLPPLLRTPQNFKKICISSVIISSIYLILSISSVLFVLPSILSVDELMPLYVTARYLEFGSFIQRLESVFLLIWMISFGCYLSIAIRFSSLIFKKITNIKNTTVIGYILPLLILAISLIPKNYAISRFFEDTIYKYTVIGFTFIFCILILILANIKKKRKVGVLNE